MESDKNENKTSNKDKKLKLVKRIKTFLIKSATAAAPVIIYHIIQTVEQIEITELVNLINEMFGLY